MASRGKEGFELTSVEDPYAEKREKHIETRIETKGYKNYTMTSKIAKGPQKKIGK